MEITEETIKAVHGEADAQDLYKELRRSGDFPDYVKRFVFVEDQLLARYALWILTKASDAELSQLQPLLHDLIDLVLQEEDPSVRRMTMTVVERMKMEEEDLRTDFLDFCLEHMVDVEEYPGIQTLCMKLAFRMSRFYPELSGEYHRIVEAMRTDFYKPAVKSLRNRILSGKYK